MILNTLPGQLEEGSGKAMSWDPPSDDSVQCWFGLKDMLDHHLPFQPGNPALDNAETAIT